MTAQERKEIETLLEYMWSDEETHYESSPRKDHIFVVLKRLARKVGYKAA